MTPWNTPDAVTNSNLSYLESIAKDRDPPFDETRINDRFSEVISVVETLPLAVRKHFSLNAYIANFASFWSPETRNEKAAELSDALARGLEAVAADPDLRKGGDADWSDRPRTRGEDILDAAAALKRELPTGHFHASLQALRTAVAGTSLQRHLTEIDRVLAKKRWDRPTSREYEIYRELGSIEFAAKRYFRKSA